MNVLKVILAYLKEIKIGYSNYEIENHKRNPPTSGNMTNLKTIYVDIMVDGYFYKQVSFTHNEAFPIFQSQLRELVLDKYPSLKNKQFTIELSNQRIIGH